MSLDEDSLFNVCQRGIKDDIDFNIEGKRYRAAVILIYAGIDAMAFLDMPAGQDDVRKIDFIAWAERWIHFSGQEKLTGQDLYGARCANLHRYGTESRMFREGECRQIGYVDNDHVPIRFDPKVSTELVMVSIQHLRTAFFEGMNRYFIWAYQQPEKKKSIEERLSSMTHHSRLEES